MMQMGEGERGEKVLALVIKFYVGWRYDVSFPCNGSKTHF